MVEISMKTYQSFHTPSQLLPITVMFVSYSYNSSCFLSKATAFYGLQKSKLPLLNNI